MNDSLERIATQELDALGFDLVELKTGGSKSRPTIELRVDRRDGAKVSVGDCATVSRAVEARLDAENVMGERYVLEVSSPGADRPLKTAAHWRRFIGRRAKVLSPALGGREEVEILGVEGEDGAELIVVRNPKGQAQRIPLAEVREARLAFHW